MCQKKVTDRSDDNTESWLGRGFKSERGETDRYYQHRRIILYLSTTESNVQNPISEPEPPPQQSVEEKAIHQTPPFHVYSTNHNPSVCAIIPCNCGGPVNRPKLYLISQAKSWLIYRSIK